MRPCVCVCMRVCMCLCTQAINSHMEDRPTVSTVKHLIESSQLDTSERVTTALLPVWDAVRGLQGGIRELGNTQQDTQGDVTALKHALVRPWIHALLHMCVCVCV